MAGEEHLRELEEKYEDYKVYDRNGERIGKVDDLFIDETDREEYIGVKLGFFGLKSTLIPMEVVRVNEAERRMEVSETKDTVKSAPTFSDDDEIDARFEEEIRRHFRLETGASESRGSYGAYAGPEASGSTGGRESAESRGYEGRGTEGEPSTTGRSREGQSYEMAEGRHDDSASEPGTSEYRGTQGMRRGEVPGGETSSERTGEVPTGDGGGGERGEGRARVRRRVIREEIIEEDPDNEQRR